MLQQLLLLKLEGPRLKEDKQPMRLPLLQLEEEQPQACPPPALETVAGQGGSSTEAHHLSYPFHGKVLLDLPLLMHEE